MSREIALEVPCHDNTLIGVLHRGYDDASVGVVVVVGGPQYRVGSHRQFVLLARALAYAGIPVLRFDYRGMGDSPGEPRQFGDVDDDIKAAINTLCENVTTLKKIVIWGLCDAASAALFYAHKDPRVSGVGVTQSVGTDRGRNGSGVFEALLLAAFFQRGILEKIIKRAVEYAGIVDLTH